MKILNYGDRGSLVSLLQLGLLRAGYDTEPDGVFGRVTQAALREFQRSAGLSSDGVAGPATQRALEPWYLGYVSYTIRRGDTLFSIAAANGATVRALETANPGADPLGLVPGRSLIVPLPFAVTPTDIPWSSRLVELCVRGITARYPFTASAEYGRSVMGRPLRYLALGSGPSAVLYNAQHHANEWITTPVLMKYAEELAKAYAFGGEIAGVNAGELLSRRRIFIAPAVNPDGMDLVTGALNTGEYYAGALRISADYPQIPFPSGWKANIRGVDPNLQYPAGWEQARSIKFAQGYVSPAPRDYVGAAPLEAPESRALYDLTRRLSPDVTLSYHTQGDTIYWRYLDYEPQGARELGEVLARVSGYALEDTPYASGFAGYKDWFIQEYDRPGYTIECGRGVSPLPLSAFDGIYAANVGLLTAAAGY